MRHFHLDGQPEEVKARAAADKLDGPEFVGQGCTHRCGSDSYGYYVAEIIRPGRLAALLAADEIPEDDLGSFSTSFPAENAVELAAMGGTRRRYDPAEYVMRYGRHWYWCSVGEGGEIRRMPGRKVCLDWNGAYSYRDPSF